MTTDSSAGTNSLYPNGGNNSICLDEKDVGADTTSKTSQVSDEQGFDIRDCLGELEPSGEKNKYICPVCGGHNLSVDIDSGKYNCWNCEDTIGICKILTSKSSSSSKSIKKKLAGKPNTNKKFKPAPLPEGEFELLRLSGEVEIPKAVKPSFIPDTVLNQFEYYDKATKQELEEITCITYDYEDGHNVHRYQCPCANKSKGRTKTFRQSHKNDEGKIIFLKGNKDWKAYRLGEVLDIARECADIPILFLQEGESCVEIARSIKLASWTMQGSGWSDLKRILNEITQKLPGKKLICFLHDPDETGLNKLAKFSRECSKQGIPFISINPKTLCDTIPDNGDIKELLEVMGELELIRQFQIKLCREEIARIYREQHGYEPYALDEDNWDEENNSIEEQEEENTLVKKYQWIERAWGAILRWNKLKQYVELNGKRLFMDELRLSIAKELNLVVSKEDAKSIILELARKNEYHPFREYLDNLKTGGTEILNNLAARYLGANSPLAQVLLAKTLIAAVARIYNPGCKHDTICILKGKQGLKKSTFWKVLAGEDFFTDDLSGTDKDEVMKLTMYVIIEFAEFETAYKKKEISQLKAFVSRGSDSIRRPYGADIEDVPRTSIFVGTTNKSEFLKDPTGERRYWVIECNDGIGEIDLKTLAKERDAIWAAAKSAYQNNEQWWLNQEEDKLLAQINEMFTDSDTWESDIANWLTNRSETTVREILCECFNLQPAEHKKSEQMRVTDILSKIGWYKGKKKRLNGKPTQTWLKPIPRTLDLDIGGNGVGTPVATGVGTEVGTPSNSVAARDAGKSVPTSSQKSVKLSETNNVTATTTQELEGKEAVQTLNSEICPKGGNGGNTENSNPDTAGDRGCSYPVATSVPTPVATENNSSFVSLLVEISNAFARKDDISLGKAVLQASEPELQAVAKVLDKEIVERMKKAANQQWKWGVNRDVDYKGERMEVMEVGQSSGGKIRRGEGCPTLSVKRGDLKPWLGI